MTSSLKCFMRRLLRRISSCQRASISGVIVNSSSFIRSSLGETSPTRNLWYAALTPCVKKPPAPPLQKKTAARSLVRRRLGLEQARQLHGQAHVTLQLELAGHEGHLAVELARGHVEP